MKAVLSKVVGGPGTLVIEDIPAPELRPGWARVKVKAVGINFPDVLIIEDKYQSKPPRPFAPGGEVSGVVTEVAEGVTEVKVGDRVLAQIGHGVSDRPVSQLQEGAELLGIEFLDADADVVRQHKFQEGLLLRIER